MSYGEHVLLAEVVVEHKAANCTQGRRFYERFLILVIICILLFGYVIWKTRFIS